MVKINLCMCSYSSILHTCRSTTAPKMLRYILQEHLDNIITASIYMHIDTIIEPSWNHRQSPIECPQCQILHNTTEELSWFLLQVMPQILFSPWRQRLPWIPLILNGRGPKVGTLYFTYKFHTVYRCRNNADVYAVYTYAVIGYILVYTCAYILKWVEVSVPCREKNVKWKWLNVLYFSDFTKWLNFRCMHRLI